MLISVPIERQKGREGKESVRGRSPREERRKGGRETMWVDQEDSPCGLAERAAMSTQEPERVRAGMGGFWLGISKVVRLE